MLKKILFTLAWTIGLSIVVSTYGGKAEAASYHYKAISIAQSNLGSKYKWGGISPSSGFDCSGLVKYSFGKQGKYLPRTAAEMYTKGSKVSKISSLQKGDLMF